VVLTFIILLIVFGIFASVFAIPQDYDNVTQQDNETPPTDNETPPGGQDNETPPNEIPPRDEGGDTVVSGSSQDLVVVERTGTDGGEQQDGQQDGQEEGGMGPVDFVDDVARIASFPFEPYHDTPTFGRWGGDYLADDVHLVPCSLSQETQSGSIPHQVVARFTNGQTRTYQAYCMEPYQRAAPGTNLNNGGLAPAVIVQTVQGSDPSNSASAYHAQLRIWVLVTGGNVDINRGEVVSMMALNGISTDQLNADLADVENEVRNDYGVSEDQIYGLTEFKVVDIFGNNLMENFLTMLRHLFGIYSQAPSPPPEGSEGTQGGDGGSQDTTGGNERDQENQTNQTDQDNTQTNNTTKPPTNRIRT